MIFMAKNVIQSILGLSMSLSMILSMNREQQ